MMPTLIELVFIAIILFTAVLVELLVATEKVRWRSRALGGSFIGAVAVCAVLIAYVLGGIWKASGFGPYLPPIEEWAGWAALPITLVLKDFLNRDGVRQIT